MSFHSSLIPLRDLLANLYSTELDARRVAAEADLKLDLINFRGAAIDYWTSVLSIAEAANRVDALIGVAKKDYDTNQRLVEVEQELRALEQTGRIETNPRTPVQSASVDPTDIGATSETIEEYEYDAYISYVDKDPDSSWVWGTLVPRLEHAQVRIAVSGDVEEPGVERIVSIELGIRRSARTIVVLSDRYLADGLARFQNVLAQTMSIQEAKYRLLPIQFEDLDESRLPTRLGMLTRLDFSKANRADREFTRLTKALQSPLPSAKL